MAILQGMGDLAGRVRTGWPGTAWEWDDRLGCALSTVGKAAATQAQALLSGALPASATAVGLGTAPALVQQSCARSGGLMGGQVVFYAELPGGAVAYCLWWPWGSGANISARIGANGLDPALVRAAFGIG
jgi:hypothetical protein